MFNKRPDGRRLKTVDPMQCITGVLMKKRYDSMNMYQYTIDFEACDRYIKEKEGNPWVASHLPKLGLDLSSRIFFFLF